MPILKGVTSLKSSCSYSMTSFKRKTIKDHIFSAHCLTVARSKFCFLFFNLHSALQYSQSSCFWLETTRTSTAHFHSHRYSALVRRRGVRRILLVGRSGIPRRPGPGQSSAHLRRCRPQRQSRTRPEVAGN